MDDRRRAVGGACQRRVLEDRSDLELDVFGVETGQVPRIACRQVVEHHDALDGVGRRQTAAETRSDEPGTAGHEHPHGR